MRKSSLFIPTILLTTATAMLAIAAPTTPPAKKPKSPPPSDWVKVESATFHFSYSVPKTWVQQGSDGSITFDLTPVKLKEKGKNFGSLAVTAAQSTAADLDAKIAELRDSLPKSTTNSKIIRDEATTLGMADHPAWLLVLEIATKTQQANAPSYVGGSTIPHDIVRKSHIYTVVALEGTTLYQASFSADGAAFSSGLSLVNRVLDSFNLPQSATPADASAANAAPTDASKPAASSEANASAGQVKIENKTYHFYFFVPKKWQKSVQNDTQTTFFMLPLRNNAPSPAMLNVVSANCHPTTVEELAKTARSDWAPHPEIKIIDDKAIELGGRPAWLFTSQETAEVPVSSTPGPAAAKAAAKTVKRTARMYKILATQGPASFEVTMFADASSYDDDLVIAKKVFDSFTWTAPDAKP
jgi:hypothetical protein